MHPDGFGEELDEKAQQRLEELNSIRKKAVLPLLKLKKDKGANLNALLCVMIITVMSFSLHTFSNNFNIYILIFLKYGII